MSVCSQCLRAMRRQARLEQINQCQAATRQQTRFLATSTTRQQQAQAKAINSETPPLIPTTTSTVTSNVTADSGSAPAPAPAPGTSTSTSTAEMQRQIRTNLSRPASNSLTMKLASSLRSASKGATETYITYGLTEALFKSCAAQAPYTIPEEQRLGVYTGKGPPKNAREEDVGIPDETVLAAGEGKKCWWFDTIGLEPTFSVWSQVCFLHMYILTVKMRTLPDNSTYLNYQRYLLEHFSNAAEDKINILHGISARGTRNKYLKDMFVQWRGVQYAYDQGLVSGDAMLAGAVWRNLWKADENVDWEKVALVVGFMRRAISGLADVDLQQIAQGLTTGSLYWEQAQDGLEEQVNMKSTGMNEPSSQPEGEAPPISGIP